ncbi:hypothetical protein B0I32_15214 [Nonomuraea fuscirosea]|uniref:Uncharacterized protein n=1 Tax=Nonomuraea fuscirosea TaxID=1291556 RepID=A0A2T0LM19_9ACTN|nr:winged helix-turn-helix domain-containing protein [Nonomuraea fuscirosea]PRX44119.1 hypothetical protein B0I32_15214 [Nonomuraea fuscirosea]
MTGSSPAVCCPLDELPDGTVKIPLDLPHGAAWPVVAQVAALSQRRAGCTASIAFLADRLGVHASTIYDALNAAGSWIITDTSTRTTRRYLAPFAEDTAWARISYRAAAGVGCHSVQGVWAPRRNRSAMLELYCRLRRDEVVGVVRSQSELAHDLEMTDRTVRSLLAALEDDGWISSRRAGRMIAYRTHDAPLHVLDTAARSQGEPSVKPVRRLEREPIVERSRKPNRNDHGNSAETITETEPAQKRDFEAGPEKHDRMPLAVGDVQHRNDDADSALSRERRINDQPGGSVRRLRPSGALSVMAAIPLAWQLRMSEQERDRVLAAVEKEMGHGRTAAEMTARIRRRLRAWYGVEPRRPIAAALTVVDRGYRCLHPECEDHLLPSGYPCPACQEFGARVNQERRADHVPATFIAADPRAETPPAPHMDDSVQRTRERFEHPTQELPRVDAAGPDGPAARARALLLATCPRTASALRASAARNGQRLPAPMTRIPG